MLRRFFMENSFAYEKELCYTSLIKPNKGATLMDANNYHRYRDAIDYANDHADRDALRRIQADMIARYGLGDKDVQYLISRFRYHID